MSCNMQCNQHLGNLRRYVMIGSRKNKIRIEQNNPLPHVNICESFITYALIQSVLQRVLICLIVQLTINKICFINCPNDIQDALTNNILNI